MLLWRKMSAVRRRPKISFSKKLHFLKEFVGRRAVCCVTLHGQCFAQWGKALSQESSLHREICGVCISVKILLLTASVDFHQVWFPSLLSCCYHTTSRCSSRLNNLCWLATNFIRRLSQHAYANWKKKKWDSLWLLYFVSFYFFFPTRK